MMKRLTLIFTVAALTLFSCGGSDESSESSGSGGDNDSAPDFSGMYNVSLDTFGISLNLMVPEIEGPMNMLLPHNLEEVEEGFLWKVSIGEEGDKFSLFIEDITGYEEEHTVQSKKDNMAMYDFMEVNYLVDEDDLIMFEKMFPGDPDIPAQYHVFGVIVNDMGTFKVYSDETVMFNQSKAEKMVLSIRSMQTSQKEA